MYQIQRTIASFCRNQSGATSIEYGLMASLLGLGIIGGAQSLGETLNSKFSQLGNTVLYEGAGTTSMKGSKAAGFK